jgi:hypothetical protein
MCSPRNLAGQSTAINSTPASDNSLGSTLVASGNGPIEGGENHQCGSGGVLSPHAVQLV